MPKKNKINLDKKKSSKQQSSIKASGTPQKDDKELEPKITQDEFNNLEKTEQKKKLFGFLKSMKKDKTSESDQAQTQSELEKKLNEVMLKTEKLEGKLEIFQSSKSESGERIANLSEEVGELRSMIFSKEDTFAKIEDEFEKIKESTEHMKPEKIHRELEDHAAEVMKVQAEIELQKSRINNAEKLIDKTGKVLDKFKSYENLLDISKEIKKQTEKINDSEKYTTRMAAKTEKIFAELDNSLTDFQKYKKELDDMNEMLKDTIKSIDTLEIKTDSRMSKESFSKIKQEQDNKSAELDTRIKALKDIVSTMLNKMSTHDANPPACDPTIKSELHESILKDIESTIHTGVDSKLNKQADELKASISQVTNLVSIIMSDERNLKQDLTNLKQDMDRKIDTVSLSGHETITRMEKKITESSHTVADILSISQKKEHSMLHDLDVLKQNSSKRASSISALEHSQKLHTRRFNKISASDNTLKTAVKEQASTLNSISAKMNNLKKYNTTLNKIKKDITSLKDSKDNIKVELSSKLSKTTDQTNKTIKEISSALATLKDNQIYLKDSMDLIPSTTISQKKEHSMLHDIDVLKQNSSKRASSISALERTLKYHTDQFNKISASDNTLKTAIKEQSSTLDSISAKMNDLKKYDSALDKIQNNITSLKDSKDNIKEELSSKLSKTTDQTNKTIKEISSALATLKDNQIYLKDSIDIPSTETAPTNKKTNPQDHSHEKNPVPQKHIIKTPADNHQKIEHPARTDNIKSTIISTTAPPDTSAVEQLHKNPDKQLQHNNPKSSFIKNTQPIAHETPRQSLYEKHVEKVKNIFQKITPAQPPTQKETVPIKNQTHSQTTPQPIHPTKQTESENLKETLKESIEQNRQLGHDLKSEISRLKSLYKEKQNLIENEKNTGKDIFQQQILLDNASLDLSMAELDLLDGNEQITKQKIEKVSTVLENI